MKKLKTSDLDGAALDWAVAKSYAWPIRICAPLVIDKQSEYCETYSPSTNWSQCGPLIEEYKVGLLEPRGLEDYWTGWAGGSGGPMLDGSTALIAACRAIVAAKLGDSVEVPEELL